MPIDFTWPAVLAFIQVVLIDAALAGDNALIIGMAVVGLPAKKQRIAIPIGVAAAAVLRIFLALATTYLLAITGLTLIGGILLLWVCWSMLRDWTKTQEKSASDASPHLSRVIWTIIIADLSMSLDNVLAVAGAAIGHPYILVFGLILSVALMGFAATLVARLLVKYPWIQWIGLALIALVALRLVINGAIEVWQVA